MKNDEFRAWVGSSGAKGLCQKLSGFRLEDNWILLTGNSGGALTPQVAVVKQAKRPGSATGDNMPAAVSSASASNHRCELNETAAPSQKHSGEAMDDDVPVAASAGSATNHRHGGVVPVVLLKLEGPRSGEIACGIMAPATDDLGSQISNALLNLINASPDKRVHAGSGLGKLYMKNDEFRAWVGSSGAKGLCQKLSGFRLEDNWILLTGNSGGALTPQVAVVKKAKPSGHATSDAMPAAASSASASNHLGEVNEAAASMQKHSGEAMDDVPAAASAGSASNQHQGGVVPKAAMSRDLLATIRSAKALRILEVGSGDGSHPLSFVDDLPDPKNLVVTCYDSRAGAEEKYPGIDGPSAAANFQQLEAKGVRLVFEVDATQLAAHDLGKFDIAMFYFPHTGVPNGQREACMQSNRSLISGFFKSVQDVMVEGGEVHMALKTDPRYAAWNVEELIASAGMKKTDEFELNKEEFPEYAHRMTLGSKGPLKQVPDKGAKVYLCEPSETLARTAGVRRICDTSIRLRITCVDGETDADVGAAVESLLKDVSAPQNVLEIRSALQSRHDTRQLNRVLAKLVGGGQVTKIDGHAGKPKYMVSGSSHPTSSGALEDGALQARIMNALRTSPGALDTLQVAKAVELTVQKEVRGVLEQLLMCGLVVQEHAVGSARPQWRRAV